MASHQTDTELLNNEDFPLTKLRLLSRASNGEQIAFDARVHALHPQGPITGIFLTLRDDGDFLEVLVDPELVGSKNFEEIRKVTLESIIRVYGTVESATKEKASPSVRISKVVFLAAAVPNLPQGVVSHGDPKEQEDSKRFLNALQLNERLNNRVLDVRVAATGAIFKLYSGILELAVEHQTSHGFTWISAPSLIDYKIAGDEDYFPVPFFDHPQAYLAQTAEVHLQLALAMDLERVFSISTVFRQEKKVSNRHLAEFTALEVMMKFNHSWHEVLESAESLFVYVIRSLQEKEKYRRLIDLAKRLYPSVGNFALGLDKNGRFISLKFSEAKSILREKLGFQADDQADLTKEEEAALGGLLRSADSGFGPPTDVFVIIDYPAHIRPFNVQTKQGHSQITNSFDVILRGQEALTGWQAIHSHSALRAAMVARDPPLNPDDPHWRPYVGSYEAGSPPQGGYGIGMNRLLQGILGLSDIHEAALFPRDASRLAP